MDLSTDGRATAAPHRVLVVDDNDDQTQILALLLEQLGHAVRVARNGRQALEIATAFEPDVAIVDIGLPDMNGCDVARRLRADGARRRMTLIAQTGWGEPEDRDRSLAAGFDHHLVKPVPFELIEGILSVLPTNHDGK